MNKKMVSIIVAASILFGAMTINTSMVSAEVKGIPLSDDFDGFTEGEALPSNVDSGNWKFYNGNNEPSNTAIYTSEASHGTDSKLGIKAVKSTASSNFQINCEVDNFDPSKIYEIKFDANGNGKSWPARFNIKNSEYKVVMIGDGLTSGELWLSGEWKTYTMTFGPKGTEGVTYTYNPTKILNNHIMIQFNMADEGTLYIDNFSMKEYTGPKPSASPTPTPAPTIDPNAKAEVINGDFENTNEGEAVTTSPGVGECGFYNAGNLEGNSAVYSSDASCGEDSEMGLKLQRGSDASSSDVQVNCMIAGINPDKTYTIKFDANGNGRSWASRFKIRNSEYTSILSGTPDGNGEVWLAGTWTNYSINVGPEGDKNADYTFNKSSIIGNTFTITFWMADIGTLYLDNLSIEEYSDKPKPTPTPSLKPQKPTNAPISQFTGNGEKNVKDNNGNYIDVVLDSNASSYTNQGFTDLSSVKWAETSINRLYALGIVSGKGSNIFAPNDVVKREEFVKMLVGAIGLQVQNGENLFADVDFSHWSYKYLIAAKNNGLVSGIDENNFGLGKQITREDMAVIAERAIKYSGEVLYDNKYDDEEEISEYAKNSVKIMRLLGIMQGDNNRFSPKAIATRAQAAVLIDKVREYLKQQKG